MTMRIWKDNRRKILRNLIRSSISTENRILIMIQFHRLHPAPAPDPSLPCHQPFRLLLLTYKWKREWWGSVWQSRGIQDCNVTVSYLQVILITLLLLLLLLPPLLIFSIRPISSDPLPSSHCGRPPPHPPPLSYHRISPYTTRTTTNTTARTGNRNTTETIIALPASAYQTVFVEVVGFLWCVHPPHPQDGSLDLPWRRLPPMHFPSYQKPLSTSSRISSVAHPTSPLLLYRWEMHRGQPPPRQIQGPIFGVGGMNT